MAIIDTTVQEIYDKYLKDTVRNIMGKPIGEIVQFPYEVTDETLKLLDDDNILEKASYPDLYEVIGDYYTNYYKKLYPGGDVPIATTSQFMIPNLAGRYLVQRTEDGAFEYTPASLQAFKIVVTGGVARVASFNEYYNDFKPATEFHKARSTTQPVKSLKLANPLPEENTNRVSINIADKAINFYMRVK